MYTNESVLYRILNRTMGESDNSKVDTRGPDCYFLNCYPEASGHDYYVGITYCGIKLDEAVTEIYKQAVEADTIEEAYQEKRQKKVEIDHYIIDLSKNIQIIKNQLSQPVTNLTHFRLVTAEWLYRHGHKLDIGNATVVEEAAAGIIQEGNLLNPPRPVTAARLSKTLMTVKDRSLDEIVTCCIRLYTD
ncbi:unnamed protein product [Rotaria magnacalcarata]|uniref:Uncharacterized protein n=1 Tax=Rotaria magnacalcarata TaxID=392030 RepID=A0A8S2P7M8_9BILA|nr:unnamed protein product [Rotaria magnacalcarata]CAF4038219.1 unnamed protein product [Rotaria magnacalcarata]